MELEAIAREMAKKDFDLDYFVERTLSDASFRDRIVRLTLGDGDIMVYYHGYYILDKACEGQPDLFYPYWDDFAALLRHKNSYHRDIGLTILAHLLRADRDGRFPPLSEEYFSHMHDEKYMTGAGCIRRLIRIVRYEESYIRRLLPQLLDHAKQTAYSAKQEALLQYDILEFMEEVYSSCGDTSAVNAYILEQAGSISPKTKKKAKQLLSRFEISS